MTRVMGADDVAQPSDDDSRIRYYAEQRKRG